VWRRQEGKHPKGEYVSERAGASRFRLFLCLLATSENSSMKAVETFSDSLAKCGFRVISHPSWRRGMRVYWSAWRS
jgi:hypothetical protein